MEFRTWSGPGLEQWRICGGIYKSLNDPVDEPGFPFVPKTICGIGHPAGGCPLYVGHGLVYSRDFQGAKTFELSSQIHPVCCDPVVLSAQLLVLDGHGNRPACCPSLPWPVWFTAI